MGCSTYLGLAWRYQSLAPGHPTSICDIGVKVIIKIIIIIIIILIIIIIIIIMLNIIYLKQHSY